MKAGCMKKIEFIVNSTIEKSDGKIAEYVFLGFRESS
jgi:hypothetical protein